MRSPNIDYDLRERREDRARHGRTLEQARELWRRAAQDASLCGECFRPLSPTDSVTMEVRNIGCRRSNPVWVRVPNCLLCTLDGITLWHLGGGASFYPEPQRRRVCCANCERPLRIQGYGLSARNCCADCLRAVRSRRNKLRRRVHHEPVVCIECGRSFLPRRADAKLCSGACRQAQYRRRRANVS